MCARWGQIKVTLASQIRCCWTFQCSTLQHECSLNIYLYINSGTGFLRGWFSRKWLLLPDMSSCMQYRLRGPIGRSELLIYRLWPHKLREKLSKGRWNTPFTVIITTFLWQQKRPRNTKRGGCMVVVTHTSPCSFTTPVSNVFPKPGIRSLTVIPHLLVPVPLCTILPHQLPKISLSPCTSVPLHSSQTNSPSMTSEEDALKKNKQENSLPELSRIVRDQSSPWLPKKAIAKPQTEHAKYSVV